MTNHDHGFRNDAPRLLGRRQALALLGGASIGGLALPGVAGAASCVVDARETAGPFPADGRRDQGRQRLNVLTDSGVIRPDIRTSFGDKTGRADGLEMSLDIELLDARSDCAPLADHAVYIWHCDAIGEYSLYENDQNYLRGVAVSDQRGRLNFTTIFPGCYRGRWPHIHFEVFASAKAIASGAESLMVGQVAFAKPDCEAVYRGHRAYDNGMRNLSRLSFAGDGVFRDDSPAQTKQRMVAIAGQLGSVVSGEVRIGLG